LRNTPWSRAARYSGRSRSTTRSRALEVPGDELGRDRGHLDRHVVDVGTLDERDGAREPGLRLVLAEHGLPEEVDVERIALGAGAREVLAEPRAGVGHEVTDELAQADPCGGHDDLRQHRRHARAETQQRGVDGAEEALRAAREVAQEAELVRGDLDVLGACDVVDEPHRELEARRVGHEGAEALGRPALARPFRGGGRGRDPAAGEARGVVGQGVDRGADRDVDLAVERVVEPVQGRGGAGS